MLVKVILTMNNQDKRGYTLRVQTANLKAPQHLLGVQLGKLCIENEIPVRIVAEHFKGSRYTIYQWFSGEWEPRAHNNAVIEEAIESDGVTITS